MRDRQDILVARRLAEQVDRQHGARPQRSFATDRGDRLAEAGRVEGEVGPDVDQHRHGTCQRHGLGGGGEGEGRHEDGIAGADAARQQREHQRIGAAGTRDRVPDADTAGDRLLERPDLRPEDELAMRDHARDRRLDAPGQAPALGGEIDQRQL